MSNLINTELCSQNQHQVDLQKHDLIQVRMDLPQDQKDVGVLKQPEVEKDKFFITNLVISYLKTLTDSIILFYSGGKDSVALLHMLSFHFKRIVCVFEYFVKDLELIQPYLDITKKYKNVELLQVIHPMSADYLYTGHFCVPNKNFQKILKISKIESNIRKQTGIDWIIYGIKKADSMQRNIMLSQYEYEAINHKNKKAFPLSKWLKKDVLMYLKMNNLLYLDLKQGKSNGIDLDYNTLKLLQTKYPNDYKKVLAVFPFAETIIYEKEYGTT